MSRNVGKKLPSWTLRMEPTGRPETPVTNRRYFMVEAQVTQVTWQESAVRCDLHPSCTNLPILRNEIGRHVLGKSFCLVLSFAQPYCCHDPIWVTTNNGCQRATSANCQHMKRRLIHKSLMLAWAPPRIYIGHGAQLTDHPTCSLQSARHLRKCCSTTYPDGSLPHLDTPAWKWRRVACVESPEVADITQRFYQGTTYCHEHGRKRFPLNDTTYLS